MHSRDHQNIVKQLSSNFKKDYLIMGNVIVCIFRFGVPFYSFFRLTVLPESECSHLSYILENILRI